MKNGTSGQIQPQDAEDERRREIGRGSEGKGEQDARTEDFNEGERTRGWRMKERLG